MITLTKPAMTRLARALRAELAFQDIPVGHQTALNLAIEAIGLGSPNAALAMLDRGAVLLDHTAWRVFIQNALREGNLDRGPVENYAVLQFGRLVEHEHVLRGGAPGAEEAPAHRQGGVLGLDERQTASLLAAACVACDLRIEVDGTTVRLRLPMDEGLDGSPFMLRAIAEDYPSYPLIDMQDPAKRLSAALRRLPGLKGGGESFDPQRGGAALLTALTSVEREVEPGAERWAQALSKMPRLVPGGGPNWFSTIGASVMHHLRDLGLLAVVLPDGSMRHMEKPGWNGLIPDTTAEDLVLWDEAHPYRETRSALYCQAEIGGAPRIGKHLFTETRDGVWFHTFDLGGDPEHADLVYGEFRWLQGQAASNAAVRFALQGVLANESMEALHADIETFLATPLREEGAEGQTSALIARAITVMSEAHEALSRRI